MERYMRFELFQIAFISHIVCLLYDVPGCVRENPHYRDPERVWWTRPSLSAPSLSRLSSCMCLRHKHKNMHSHTKPPSIQKRFAMYGFSPVKSDPHFFLKPPFINSALIYQATANYKG